MSPVEVGTTLPSISTVFTRTTLVRYAGASTDFNPIHYSDAKAAELGLPGVIAHGMLTMGAALRVVTDWCGDRSRVLSARPVHQAGARPGHRRGRPRSPSAAP